MWHEVTLIKPPFKVLVEVSDGSIIWQDLYLRYLIETDQGCGYPVIVWDIGDYYSDKYKNGKFNLSGWYSKSNPIKWRHINGKS